ncbi:MAG: RNA pyrophosphohydrolase [Gammaproteobacteria bacterium]
MTVQSGSYRRNVGIILINNNERVFWAKRVGQDAWQFPQGGIDENESAEQAMYRELTEEIGLEAADVTLMGVTEGWLSYRIPKQYIRRGSQPLVIGQKQKWFLLKLVCSEQKIRLDLSSTPEFDSWCWVDYWYPPQEVIYFKRQIYTAALKELEQFCPDACRKPAAST